MKSFLFLGLFFPLLTFADVAIRDSDSKYCEIYVNSLAERHQHYGGGGYDEVILRSYLSVNERDLVEKQGGKIEKVGMLVVFDEFQRDSGASKIDETSWVEGIRIEPAYYQVDFTLDLLRGTGGARENLLRHIRHFAYFLTVKRANGELERLWLKNGDQDFTHYGVTAGIRTVSKSLGSGYELYYQEPSSIYSRKRECKR